MQPWIAMPYVKSDAAMPSCSATTWAAAEQQDRGGLPAPKTYSGQFAAHPQEPAQAAGDMRHSGGRELVSWWPSCKLLLLANVLLRDGRPCVAHPAPLSRAGRRRPRSPPAAPRAASSRALAGSSFRVPRLELQRSDEFGWCSGEISRICQESPSHRLRCLRPVPPVCPVERRGR